MAISKAYEAARDGRYGDAIGLVSGVPAEERDRFAWHLLGACCNRTAEYGEALYALRRAYALAPGDLDVLEDLFCAVMAHGDVKRAKRLHEEFRRAGAPQWKLGLQQARLWIAHGRLVEAELAWSEAVEQAPTAERPYVMWSVSEGLLRGNRLREALHVLEGSQVAEELALLQRAEVHRRLGERKEFAEVLGLAVERGYRSTSWTMPKAMWLWGSGDREGAVAILEGHFKAYPKDPFVTAKLALCLHEMGRRDDALRYARLALEIEPRRAEVLDSVVAVFRRSGRKSEAFRAAWRALRGPKSGPAR